MLKTEELKLVSEWDKTFPKSEKVDQRMWHRCFRQSSRTEMHRKWRKP